MTTTTATTTTETEESLYEILGVDDKATSSEIKKAYYKKARECHPDNQQTGNTELFQKLGKAYEILSDEKKRKRYDKTGSIDDILSDHNDDDFDWDEYWRALFKEVSEDDIHNFSKEYRESEEEKRDVKNAYVECEGDMDEMLTMIMLSRECDVDRFCEWIDEWIKDGSVENYKKYQSTCKTAKAKKLRAKKLQEESEEAQEVEKQQTLQDLIKNKQVALTKQQRSFNDLVNKIQSKYMDDDQSNKKKKKKNNNKRKRENVEPDEISEEEFQKIQQQLQANKSAKRRRKN